MKLKINSEKLTEEFSIPSTKCVILDFYMIGFYQIIGYPSIYRGH